MALDPTSDEYALSKLNLEDIKERITNLEKLLCCHKCDDIFEVLPDSYYVIGPCQHQLCKNCYRYGNFKLCPVMRCKKRINPKDIYLDQVCLD